MMCIAQRRIFDWLQLVQPIQTEDSSNKEDAPLPSSSLLSSRCTKQLLDYDIEKELHTWVQNQLPRKVSSSVIREKAKKMYSAKGHTSFNASYGWYRRWSARFNKTTDPHEETDVIILTWMLECYDQNQVVTISELQQYGQKSLSSIKPGFCASAGWATRFLKRHHLLLNCEDVYNGQLPGHLENDLEAFLMCMKNSVMTKYHTSRIGSVDEIPLSFSDLTNDHLQASTRVKKYSIVNCDATVILALMANGELLPPFVIIKGQHQADLYRVYSQQYHSVVVYYCQNTNPTLMALEKWHELVWLQHFGVGGDEEGEQALLLLDDYKLHHEFKAKINSESLSIELFPPGCSCKLQPLNSSIRRQFLSSMEDYWLEHVKRGSAKTKIQLPSTDEIIQWVSGSYEKLKEQKELLGQAFTTTKLVASPGPIK